MLWRHKFHDIINTMTSSFHIKSFFLISLKTDIVNRNCRQEETEKYVKRNSCHQWAQKLHQEIKLRLAIAMATREMAIAFLQFLIKRLRILHKSRPLSVQSFYTNILDICWFKQKMMKITNFHEFSHFFPGFIAFSRKMNLTDKREFSFAYHS